MANKGYITQIVGPVVDVRFDEAVIPEILHALEINQGIHRMIIEVLQHIGDNRVRCVAMEATEGLARGMEVIDTGHPIQVPVGEAVLGRMFRVTGEVMMIGAPLPQNSTPPYIGTPPTLQNSGLLPRYLKRASRSSIS